MHPGRDVRAVRRGLPAARRAFAVRGGEQRSILVNTGAEAVENAVKIARAATGRPAVVVFEGAFHGRTLLAMTMTSKVKPYKAGFGPFAPEVYRAPAPYPYRGISSDDAIAALEHLFKADVDPATVACVVLEPVQGEGGFIAMPRDYLAAAAGALPRARDPVRRRRGAVGRRPHRAHVGGRALRRCRAGPPRHGQVDRRRAPARGRDGPRGAHGRGPARRARRHVRRQPARRARPRSPCSTSSPTRTSSRRRASSARRSARASTTSPRGTTTSARCAGSARCSRSSSRSGRPTRAKAVVDAAFERGLVLLSCGLYGNVIRLLPPLTISPDELDEGLAILEESLAA